MRDRRRGQRCPDHRPRRHVHVVRVRTPAIRSRQPGVRGAHQLPPRWGQPVHVRTRGRVDCVPDRSGRVEPADPYARPA
jgi:hypothetical protein